LIFVDTGPFLGRYLERDQHHRDSLASWERLKGEILFISEHVLDEVVTLLGRRCGSRFAADRADQILHSPAIRVLRCDPDVERIALNYFRKFGDLQISFTDATSFALMEKNKLRRVFTFDFHFEAAGFHVLR